MVDLLFKDGLYRIVPEDDKKNPCERLVEVPSAKITGITEPNIATNLEQTVLSCRQKLPADDGGLEERACRVTIIDARNARKSSPPFSA